ncbi:MAG: aspartate carbamoyltransferase regulatory subunit [Alloprevotella sp.]|nr:aspartate carbamoyltransferase regulatory subunit [Alloprevotella sp.]
MSKQLQVAALRNGTVIDHIPNEKLQEVEHLLQLDKLPDSSIMIGYNLDSEQMGHKSLIKVSNHYFSKEELDTLCIAIPDATLSIVKDYEVVEKRSFEMPTELTDIVACSNPMCITNNEPMRTRFHYLSDKHALKCHYCGKEVDVNHVKFAK